MKYNLRKAEGKYEVVLNPFGLIES